MEPADTGRGGRVLVTILVSCVLLEECMGTGSQEAPHECPSQDCDGPAYVPFHGEARCTRRRCQYFDQDIFQAWLLEELPDEPMVELDLEVEPTTGFDGLQALADVIDEAIDKLPKPFVLLPADDEETDTQLNLDDLLDKLTLEVQHMVAHVGKLTVHRNATSTACEFVLSSAAINLHTAYVMQEQHLRCVNAKTIAVSLVDDMSRNQMASWFKRDVDEEAVLAAGKLRHTQYGAQFVVQLEQGQAAGYSIGDCLARSDRRIVGMDRTTDTLTLEAP